MILHTGLRTDIPAFYAQWFANRLKAGFVCVRNPYNPSLVTRYRLNPDVVDLIVFCTKNPAPLFPHREQLSPYETFWFVTITPYGKDLEPHVPEKEAVMERFRELSSYLGPDHVAWRYDPIIITEDYPLDWHIRQFEEMAAALAGCTDTCVISFLDLYKKVERNFPEARTCLPGERLAVGQAFSDIAKKYGFTLKACAEGTDLSPFGIDCSGCMTAKVYEKVLRCRLNPPKGRAARPGCACLLASDIGAYDTCGHLCRYCYANTSPSAVLRNGQNHDPDSPLITGRIGPDDLVRDAKQVSWIDEQLSLFRPDF